MNEVIKIIGKGSLNEKKYGTLPLNIIIDGQMYNNENLFHDKNLDQYRINKQWIIPFHK